MIERASRPLTSIPGFSDTSIPLLTSVQTVLMAVAFTVRWSSALLTALVLCIAFDVVHLPAESLAMLAPVIWSDRSFVSFLRIRRR